MSYRLGYSDFCHDFRGQECLVIYSNKDSSEWWISPLNDDGSEGPAFDLTDAEIVDVGTLVEEVKMDRFMTDDAS